MSKYEKGVWYPWGDAGDQTGEFPVPLGTKVTVRHRDGDVIPDQFVGYAYAETWSVGEERDRDGDIMAFMVEED